MCPRRCRLGGTTRVRWVWLKSDVGERVHCDSISRGRPKVTLPQIQSKAVGQTSVLFRRQDKKSHPSTGPARPVPETLGSRPGLADDGGVLQYVEAELAALLGGVHLVGPRRRKKLEVLHKATEGDAEDGEREDDAGAAPAAHAEGQVPEIVAVGLHLGFLRQEPLRPELLRVLPVGGIVGEPPSVDQDLALGGDVVAAELGVVEVHVWDEEGDGHAQPEGLLDHRLQVGQLRDVRLRDRYARAEHRVQLLPEFALDPRVVHQLRHPPLDGPQRRLDGCTHPR
ncbi:hypothetical protein BHE74_00038249 [Ensete ventricosum]|nr:hypothetical protein BHE74_00038249 [Ensete ventricosum]